MKRKIITGLIVIMAIALVAIFAGCVENKEVTPSTSTTPIPSPIPTSTPTPILAVTPSPIPIPTPTPISIPTVTPPALPTQTLTPSLIPSLIQTLKDDDSSIRWKAAEDLGCLGDTRAVFPLIQALKDENWKVRWKAAEALDKIGWDLKDDTERAYYVVAKKEWAEVVKIGQPALTPLIQALKDEDWKIRRDAAEALGRIGHLEPLCRTTWAVEPLIDALKDENRICQWCAAESLELIGSTRTKHAVDLFLEEKDVDLKYIAENYTHIIEKGKSGDDLLLIVALDRCGNSSMAKDFLNCGNSKLVDAAEHWAEKHGYSVFVSYGGGSPGPRWGQA